MYKQSMLINFELPLESVSAMDRASALGRDVGEITGRVIPKPIRGIQVDTLLCAQH